MEFSYFKIFLFLYLNLYFITFLPIEIHEFTPVPQIPIHSTAFILAFPFFLEFTYWVIIYMPISSGKLSEIGLENWELLKYEDFLPRILVLDWIVCPQNSYVEALTLEVTVIGNRAFKEVIKVK